MPALGDGEGCHHLAWQWSCNIMIAGGTNAAGPALTGAGQRRRWKRKQWEHKGTFRGPESPTSNRPRRARAEAGSGERITAPAKPLLILLGPPARGNSARAPSPPMAIEVASQLIKYTKDEAAEAKAE